MNKLKPLGVADLMKPCRAQGSSAYDGYDTVCVSSNRFGILMYAAEAPVAETVYFLVSRSKLKKATKDMVAYAT